VPPVGFVPSWGVGEIDPNKLPGDDAQPLPPEARVRWDAFKNAVGELVAATDDAAGLEAAARAVQQIMRGLDAKQYADALDVPEDAGEFADGLRRMLVRIAGRSRTPPESVRSAGARAAP
jgi:hypothetical protein